METTKLEKFCYKILDKLFQAVGFKQFSLDYVLEHEDWRSKNSWTQDQEEYFYYWFVENAQSDLGLNKRQANFEYKKFIQEFGWPIIHD